MLFPSRKLSNSTYYPQKQTQHTFVSLVFNIVDLAVFFFFFSLPANWTAMAWWHILDDVVNSSLFLSCVVSHCLLRRLCFCHPPTLHWYLCCELGSPFSLSMPKVKHLTQDSHFSFMQFDLIKQNHHFFLFFFVFSALAFSKLCSGNITQFKLYTVQFEEDYDVIRPIYYFMWLLMILCTQPTQLITFSMNNK